jgi:hypothetical protein
VGVDVYQNPAQLHNAASITSDLDFQFTAGANPSLVITPELTAGGNYIATVTVSDGANTDTQTINISVTDTAVPALGPIADQTLGVGDTTPTINLSLTDADTALNSLTYTGTANTQLFALDQELRLDINAPAGLSVNVRGHNEKYLFDVSSATWYYLLPNGELYRFTGDPDSSAPSSLSGTLIADVGVNVYQDPRLLYEPVSIPNALTFQFLAGATARMTVTAAANAPVGTYTGKVVVHDGQNSATQSFTVIVTP